MEALFLIALVAATSAASLYAATRRGRPATGDALRAGAWRAVEWVGLTVAFFAGNLSVGVALTLVVRSLTPLFLSLYLNADVSLLVLSALQAFVYQRWREAAEDAPPSA
jgi:hypothetical protein